MQFTKSRVPQQGDRKSSEFDLAPLVVDVTLLPRFARRLKIVATQENHTPEATAARLLAFALVPNPAERRRMVRLDLRDAGVQP